MLLFAWAVFLATTPPSGHPGVFRLTPMAAPDANSVAYLAEADRCKFEIRVDRSRQRGSAGFVQFAKGELLPGAGSSCTPFLRRLAQELAFKGALPHPPPVRRLPVAFAILGEHSSRSPENLEVEGSFRDTPGGSWLVTKMFLADGEGEVYLNLNPKRGMGEFSQKDPDYAKVVLRELAKILPP